MASVLISGDTSGAITISAPAVSGTNTLTLPVATDTLVGKATTDTLTNKTLTAPILSGSITGTYTLAGTPTLTSPTITGAVMSTMASSVITSGTTVASTSGTSIDFTGIPSWVKRITVMLSGVSTNGTSNHLIRLGDSTGFQITGYISMSQYGTSSATDTTGLLVANSIGTAEAQVGFFVITTLGSNRWVLSGAAHTNVQRIASGSVTLSGTLDRVRITTVNGTDTFDAGSINILYE